MSDSYCRECGRPDPEMNDGYIFCCDKLTTDEPPAAPSVKPVSREEGR